MSRSHFVVLQIPVLFLIFWLFSPIILLSQTPIGYNKWDMGNGSFSINVGQAVQNYQEPDKSWAKIVNAFIPEGDSVVFNETGVIKTRVNKQGLSVATVSREGQDYSVTQRLVGIGWLNIDNRQRQWIDSTMNWSNSTVTDSIIKWTNVSPGINYRIIKSNGRLTHNILFKPAFLDSAVVLYNQRGDSLNLALANVMEYSFSGNIVNADSAIGDVKKRRFKKFVDLAFGMREQGVFWTVGDTLTRETIPVRQFWIKKSSKIYCVEYIMMSAIKQIHLNEPTASIWHNASVDIGTTDIEDAWIREDSPAHNYGSTQFFFVYNGTPGSDSYKMFIRGMNLNAAMTAGYTVTACTLYVEAKAITTAGDVGVFRVWKYNWEEGVGNGTINAGVDVGITGDFWSNSTSDDWATPRAAQCTKDGGSENTTDGGACNNPNADITATSNKTITVSSTGYKVWDVTTIASADANDSINVVLKSVGSAVDVTLYSSESSGNEPYFRYIYTAGGGGGATPTRRRKVIINLGEIDNEENTLAAVDCGCPDNTK